MLFFGIVSIAVKAAARPGQILDLGVVIVSLPFLGAAFGGGVGAMLGRFTWGMCIGFYMAFIVMVTMIAVLG